MKIDAGKLNIALARNCKSMRDLRSAVSPHTLYRISQGEAVTPRTLGKIARALGVDVTEIMEEARA